MSSFVFVFGTLVAILAIGGLSYWLGRRVQKGAQTKAVEEARQRMDEVAANDRVSTITRLRSGDY